MNSDTAASRAMPRRTTANAASITPTASLAAILLSILVLVAPSAHAQTENSPPTAIGQSVSTPEDTPRAIVLTGSDPDNDPLTFSIAAAPGNGTLSGTPPNVTYTPVKDFNGTDRFFFTVSDGQVSSIPAQVEITVIPVNDPPTAVPDTLTVEEDTTINNPGNRVNVLLNDNDPDGDTLSVTSASASNGTTSILSNGNVAYSPRANYFGSDTISYTISDGKGGTAKMEVGKFEWPDIKARATGDADLKKDFLDAANADNAVPTYTARDIDMILPRLIDVASKLAVGAEPSAPTDKALWGHLRDVLKNSYGANRLYSGMGATVDENGNLGAREVMLSNNDTGFALTPDNHRIIDLKPKFTASDVDKALAPPPNAGP